MKKNDLNLKKLNAFIENRDFNFAKNYIRDNLNISDEEALKYLHKYINENNIDISNGKFAKDINIGYEKIVFSSLVVGLLFIFIFVMTIYLIKSMGKSINVLLLIILFLLNLICLLYFIILVLDILKGNTLVIKGNYESIKTNSRFSANYIIKFDSGETVIVPGNIYQVLKNYNSCELERFKYSKKIKSIKNIKKNRY
ncbi:hypothetical protein [Miniphocaeibacter halophilus]|uniref:Uncharacterized protein n=1 Tax=Miniphocaeibacter halophilus TaxID=2931922 RepID=A0AC61MTA5_9FIRM|nr:hypothetical protein [Miniphocaeibacter halophilus]QQK08934.1 hypothetical protein JFY71_05200 [Miniphocaeibacter halophilus]